MSITEWIQNLQCRGFDQSQNDFKGDNPWSRS